jgi:hypothetical protein
VPRDHGLQRRRQVVPAARIIELIAKQVPVTDIDPEGEFRSLREKFDMLLIRAGGDITPEMRTAGLCWRRLSSHR